MIPWRLYQFIMLGCIGVNLAIAYKFAFLGDWVWVFINCACGAFSTKLYLQMYERYK